MTESTGSNTTSAVQVVWQWLTYSLWEASLIALATLLSGTLSYFFVRKDSSYEFLLYAFGALVVLLPLAFVTDRIYAKRESQQKTGFAAVVMVLNALLAFLVALASTISGVLTLLSMLLNPGDSKTKTITVITMAVVAALGFLLFARILNPARPRNLTKPFPFIIAGIVAITVVLACVGPLPKEFAARNDKLIENNLYEVTTAVSNYANKNRKLPASLNDVTPSDADTKQLIASGRVEYKPDPVGMVTKADPYNGTTYGSYATTTKGDYQLCVNYTRAKNGGGLGGNWDSNGTYLSTYSHKAGLVCYKQTVTFYN